MKIVLTDVGVNYIKNCMDDNQTFTEPVYGETSQDDDYDYCLYDVTLPVTVCGDHIWVLERNVEFVFVGE